MIQPHLPIRLPCYDFTPVIGPAFGSSFFAVRSLTSGVTDSHGVTGGVYKTREKVCRSFATVLKLMDEYPNYKFMSSQPQLYYFLKQRYPELYEQIKQRVAEGRWEPEGGMWVEADCNLTSGESLVRQFLYGKRFFKEEF